MSSPTVICPTVTAFDTHEYRAQMELIEPFARRVHIDLMDGVFAPTKSPDLKQIWWPEDLVADIHLMYKFPEAYVDQLIDLNPNLVIIHAEAEGDLTAIAERLQAAGIKAGLALLQNTDVANAKSIINKFDHVLIFSGNLGYHGGSKVDFTLLDKVKAVRDLKPDCEIGWDGGVSDQSAVRLVSGGVDVLNAGSYIHASPEPYKAYGKLKEIT